METLYTILIKLALFSVCWCLAHEILYRMLGYPSMIAKIDDKKERYHKFAHFVSYFPALAHAPITVLISLLALGVYGVKYGEGIEGFQTVPMYFTASYFIHDTVYGIQRKYNDSLTTVHHLTTVAVVLYALFKNRYGSDLCLGLVLGEITNPIYAIADVMEFYGVASHQLKKLRLSFLVSFIFMRVVVTPPIMFKFQNSRADLFFKVVYSAMWPISMMLIWMMINKAAKILSQLMPESKPIKQFYDMMVKARSYKKYYDMIVYVITMSGIGYYYLSGNYLRHESHKLIRT